MAVDQIRRGMSGDIRTQLDHPEIAQALQQGDIAEIMRALPSGVTRADIEEYLKHRFLLLDQALFQNTQIKADAASIPPPDWKRDLPPVNAAHRLDDADGRLLFSMLKHGRAAKNLDPEVDPNVQAQQDVEKMGNETLQMVGDHAQQYDDFANYIQDQVFTTQLRLQMESKRSELREEFQKIVAAMRAGQIQPEFVLLALAKVQSSEQGVLFSQLGQRVMHVSQEQSDVAKSISAVDASNAGAFEMKKLQIGQMSNDMNQMMSMMQRTAQGIDSILSTAKSQIEEYNRTKGELIRRIAVS